MHWLSAPAGLVWWAAGLAAFAVKAFAAVDAALRPQTHYRVADVSRTKTFWVLLLVAAVVVSTVGVLALAGLVVAVVYLVDVRPRLREVRRTRDAAGSSGAW